MTTLQWIAILVLILFVALAIFVAVSYGFFPPPGAHVLIHIKDGKINVRKGAVDFLARNHLNDIVTGAGVKSGFIAITSRRIVFSRQIPAEIHQRIRNVLLNQ